MVEVLGTPVSGREGLGTLTQKSTFPKAFCAEMRDLTDKVIQNNQNTITKIENRIYSNKMAAETQISNSRHKHFPPKMGKPTFQKDLKKKLAHNWRSKVQCTAETIFFKSYSVAFL